MKREEASRTLSSWARAREEHVQVVSAAKKALLTVAASKTQTAAVATAAAAAAVAVAVAIVQLKVLLIGEQQRGER